MGQGAEPLTERSGGNVKSTEIHDPISERQSGARE
jgi:hypothetical protein